LAVKLHAANARSLTGITADDVAQGRGCGAHTPPQDPAPMPAALPRLLLPVVFALLVAGCTDAVREDTVVSPEEQALLERLKRDAYLDIMALERDDFDHLVVTTRQGSQRVRYVIKPTRPGEAVLVLHRINDRSTLEVQESDQLGTGPQPARNGRYR
jgi:hypothetical protein